MNDAPPPISELWACTAQEWSPQIGDPTIIGWATVLAYGVAAFLSLRLMLSPSRRIASEFWFTLFLLLTLLCINKQLDLQSAATSLLRCHAQIFDWYQYRRAAQLIIVLVIGAIVLVFLATTGWKMRKRLKSHWQAILGICVLSGFVAIRAVSFTHVDRLIRIEVGSFKMNHVLELTGIALIAWNAVILLRKIKYGRRRRS